MSRKSCTFVCTLITIVTSLVAYAWAQAPAGGFEQFWGPNYTYPTVDRRAHGPVRRRTRRRRRDAPLESRRHRFERTRPYASPLTAIRGSSASSSVLADRAARWPSSTSRCSTPSTRSPNAIAATPGFADAAPGGVDGRGDCPGGARHARRDVSLAEGSLRRAARRRAGEDRRRAAARRRASGSGSARRAPSWRAGTTTARDAAEPETRHRLPHQQSARASGGRIRSASFRSRSARSGARSTRSSCRTSPASEFRRRRRSPAAPTRRPSTK